MPTESTHPFLKLHTATAAKLGRSGGYIQFLVLADPELRHFFLALSANLDGSGCFSPEAVALDAIEAALPQDPAEPFPARRFAPCFQGRSSNNPGFLAAVLRHLGLLRAVPDKPNLHVVAGDWAAWQADMLRREGEPYAPPVKGGPGTAPSAALSAADAQAQEATGPVPAADVQGEPLQAVTGQPGPAKGRRRGGKVQDPEPRHPTQQPEVVEHAHPA
jgi:hypothetical protein